jgi:enterochelin esterase family protein
MQLAKIAILLLLFPGISLGQQANVNLDWNPQQNRENLIPYGAAVNSPEVHADGSVTFRVQAPDANHVELSGSALLNALDRGGSPVPFTVGEDGVWSLTVGAVRPDIYSYYFLIDGAQVADPNNSIASFAAAPPSSELVVHNEGPAWYDARNVPHGTVTRHIYHSGVTGGERDLYVYTPPEYDDSLSYPVLYLLAGSSSLPTNWIYNGRVHFIMDNLLAESRAEPMIIVIPNNQVVHRNHPNHAELTFELFERELREHVIPFIDAAYATQPGPQGRALSGLSMGGRHTMFIGFGSPDLFGSLGILSAGDENAETVLADFLNDPAANTYFDYLFIGQGTLEEAEDFFNVRVASLTEALETHGIDYEYYAGGYGAHDWTTWRHLLYFEFLPNLWRQ